MVLEFLKILAILVLVSYKPVSYKKVYYILERRRFLASRIPAALAHVFKAITNGFVEKAGDWTECLE